MHNFVLIPEFISENIIIRLILASILGGIIGFEREIHGRAAGLRTNLLISLGAAVFMIISESFALSFAKHSGNPVLKADLTRIAAQIVTGIGFLGAGAIVKYGFSIRGLTTAACIWMSAGIGMSVGAGFFELAILTTAIALFCLVILNIVERLYAKDSYYLLEIETDNNVDIEILLKKIKRKNLKVLHFDKYCNYVTKKNILKIAIRLHYQDNIEIFSKNVILDIEKMPINIYQINWLHQ